MCRPCVWPQPSIESIDGADMDISVHNGYIKTEIDGRLNRVFPTYKIGHSKIAEWSVLDTRFQIFINHTVFLSISLYLSSIEAACLVWT